MPIALHVALENGRFVDGYAPITVELREHRPRVAGGEQHLIPVQIQLETGGSDATYGLDLGVDVPPRPGLNFVGGVAVRYGLLGLLGKSLRRHVNIPPADGAPIANLRQVQQAIEGHLQCLPHHIVKSHLQPGPKPIVAQKLRRIAADYALNGLFRYAPPRVVQQCLPETYQPAHVGGYTNDLANAPLPNLPLVPNLAPRGERHVNHNPFNRLYLQAG